MTVVLTGVDLQYLPWTETSNGNFGHESQVVQWMKYVILPVKPHAEPVKKPPPS